MRQRAPQLLPRRAMSTMTATTTTQTPRTWRRTLAVRSECAGQRARSGAAARARSIGLPGTERRVWGGALRFRALLAALARARPSHYWRARDTAVPRLPLAAITRAGGRNPPSAGGSRAKGQVLCAQRVGCNGRCKGVDEAQHRRHGAGGARQRLALHRQVERACVGVGQQSRTTIPNVALWAANTAFRPSSADIPRRAPRTLHTRSHPKCSGPSSSSPSTDTLSITPLQMRLKPNRFKIHIQIHGTRA